MHYHAVTSVLTGAQHNMRCSRDNVPAVGIMYFVLPAVTEDDCGMQSAGLHLARSMPFLRSCLCLGSGTRAGT